ncbi:hypothetical protein LXA26_18320, partial [Erwinia amylovora]|uniref:hypothetical protein n=1 Tax=Erwinia amylovora TaxID=552 RepID=UPI0020C0FB65
TPPGAFLSGPNLYTDYPYGRPWGTATFLPSGKVLVAAGADDAYPRLVATEDVFDPACGTACTIAPGAAMTSPRQGPG